MTDDSPFKKQVRARMAETGENYTTGRRMVIAGHDPGQLPAALRVYPNPYVDLDLTDEAGKPVRLNMVQEEPTGKPVQLNMTKDPGPPKGRQEWK